MATMTLEKRLSAVEAELAEMKRLLGLNGTQQELPTTEGNPNASRRMTITEKLIAMADEMPEEERAKMPADLAEPHDHSIADATLSAHKKVGALDAALATIWRDTPDEAWDKLPADFGDNLDHYLYGTPKR